MQVSVLAAESSGLTLKLSVLAAKPDQVIAKFFVALLVGTDKCTQACQLSLSAGLWNRSRISVHLAR